MDLWLALADPPTHWVAVLLCVLGLLIAFVGVVFRFTGFDPRAGLVLLAAGGTLIAGALVVVPAVADKHAAVAAITTYLHDEQGLVRIGGAHYDAHARRFTAQVVTADGTVRTATVTWLATGDVPDSSVDLPGGFEPVTVELSAADPDD